MSHIRHMRTHELFLHGLVIAVPCVVAFVLVLHRLAPSGVFTIDVGAQELSPYVHRILPIERAPNDGDGVRLVEDPAYLNITIPHGAYTSVDIALDFENFGQPVFELGARIDPLTQSYDLRSMQNTTIDDSTWNVVRDRSPMWGVDERVLLQRTKTYDTIADFLSHPPSRTSIATYHADFDAPYREATYVPTAERQHIDVSLRGTHTFATYIKNETLDVTISYNDMNRTEGADDGALYVKNSTGEIVASVRIADDGITSDGQNNSGVRTAHVMAEHLSEGVYTVSMAGTSDIFWRSIVTPQRYVTFVNQLYIADDVGYRAPRATSFVTTAKHITAETFHADSPEQIVVGHQAIALSESHTKTQADIVDPGIVDAKTPVGDVKITGSGLFAFSRTSFFNPYPVRLTSYTDLDAEGIDYVLATYDAPIQRGNGDVRATATFDLTQVRQSDGTVKCILSAPGIANTDGIRIDAVHVTFHKAPMTFQRVMAAIAHRLL